MLTLDNLELGVGNREYFYICLNFQDLKINLTVLKRGCMREWTFWGLGGTWPTPILTKTGTVVGNDPKTGPGDFFRKFFPGNFDFLGIFPGKMEKF